MANHTLSTLDSGRHLRITGSDSSVNLNLYTVDGITGPPWPNGTYFEIYNGLDATGVVNIVAQPGVTINQASGTLVIPNQGLARIYLTDSTFPPNVWDMFIVQTTASGGTPGGSNQEIQFNNAGVFGGIPGFIWDGATQSLSFYAAGPISSPGDLDLNASPSSDATSGGTAYLYGGNSAAGAGGGVGISGGNAGAAGYAGGLANLTGGYSFDNSGQPGLVFSEGGADTNGGNIGIYAGDFQDTGISIVNAGSVTIKGGKFFGTSLTGSTGGNVTLRSGEGPGAETQQYWGNLYFETGPIEQFRITGYGEWGLGGANYGTAGQVLTSGGTGAAPTWQTVTGPSPGGSTQEIQFNNAGVFGGVTGFTFDSSNGFLDYNTGISVASPGSINLRAPSASGAFSGGQVNIYSGDSVSGNGGIINLQGAYAVGSANGGLVTLNGGGSVNGTGGNVELFGGGITGSGTGGDITLAGGGGIGSGSVGGNININGGSGDSGGGYAYIIGGNGYATGANGGDARLIGGAGNSGGGAGGWVLVDGGEGFASSDAGRVTIRGGRNFSDASKNGEIWFDTSGFNRFVLARTGDWLLSGVAGTSGQVLTSNGTGAAPTWQAASVPSEPANQIVYGTGSGLDSASTFTFNPTTGGFIANVGSVSGPSATLIKAGSESGTGLGANIALRGGDSADGPGGQANLTAGNAGGTGANGGTLSIAGGNGAGSGNGGIASIAGGQSGTSGTGGDAQISGGNGGGFPGSNGGNVNIVGGIGLGTGTHGYVSVQTANVERLRVFATGSVSIGKPSLATNATDGFVYIPTTTGTPTGTPTTVTGMAPMHVEDDGASVYKLWIYTSAGWKSTTLS